MNKQIRMIVTDLDRTLLKSDKTISENSLEIFEKCRQKGIKIVIATFRSIRSASDYYSLLKCDAAAYHNGAVAYIGDELICSEKIKNDDVVSILHGIETIFPESTLSVEIDEKIYANFLDMPIEFTFTDFNDLPKMSAEKIIIGGIDLDKEAEIKKLIPDYLYTEQAGNKFIIIMNKRASNHSAVMKIADVFGIDRDEIIAFGDDYNDIGMIKNCGFGVAVFDANEKVKEAADYLTAGCDEDGVAEFLKKYIV